MDNRKVIEGLLEYLETYPNQKFYELYPPETIIHDLIYGVGISIDDKYQFADGYKAWKEYLIEFLVDQPNGERG